MLCGFSLSHVQAAMMRPHGIAQPPEILTKAGSQVVNTPARIGEDEYLFGLAKRANISWEGDLDGRVIRNHADDFDISAPRNLNNLSPGKI
jgi:hypothetical protein